MECDVGAVDDLADGSMKPVDAAGQKLLLTRLNGVYHAIANGCPHAGGPLHEGVLGGDVVLCPWHKAGFQVTTGRCVAPPALDDVPRFAVRVEAGRVLVTVEDAPDALGPISSCAEKEERCFAIVGAGAAGQSAAQSLRAEGFGGRIVLISQESALPYDRTVLSKYALSGKEGGEKSPLQNAAFYERHRIERHSGIVQDIDPQARKVLFQTGMSLTYDAALVATGGVPRLLDIEGAALDGVFVLRSAEDAQKIVSAAGGAKSVIVAGASFIGMEAAASLRERGLEVTVVAPQKVPFAHILGAEIGNAFRRVHEREGVLFRLDDEIVAIEGRERVERVRLRSGGVLSADLVVVGLGVSPATDILKGIKKREDRSVTVDSRLRLADTLFAAGDIAAFPYRGDGALVRVEHWRVAQQQGRIAALNMLGRDVVFDAIPYFWTIHFLKRLDYVGHAQEWDDIVIDGDLAAPNFIAFFLRDGVVAAVAGWDRDTQMAAAIGLMTEKRDWSLPDLRAALAGYSG